MSLINDALRRKKQESKEPAPETSGGSPMQPVAQPTRDKTSYLGPILMTLIVLVLLLAALLFWKGIETKKQLAATNARDAQMPLPKDIEDRFSDSGSNPGAATTPMQKAIETNRAQATAIASSVEELKDSVSTTTSTAVASPATNLVAPTAVPVPPPLKLQGIFYRPSNPTAMINGKTVGIGEVAVGARVLRIDRQEVAVERDGKLQILTME